MAKNKKRRLKPNLRPSTVNPIEKIEQLAQEYFLKRGGEILDFCIKTARSTLDIYHSETADYHRETDKLTVSASVATRATAQLARYRKEKLKLWDDCMECATEGLTTRAAPTNQPETAIVKAKDKTREPIPLREEPTVPNEPVPAQSAPALTG